MPDLRGKDYFTQKEAAHYVGCSLKQLYAFCDKHNIHTIRINGFDKYRKSDIADVMESLFENDETELYRHYNSDGDLLYIGISISTMLRLSGHRKDSAWFKEIETIKIERFSSRRAAFVAEEAAIKLEKPKYNIFHNK